MTHHDKAQRSEAMFSVYCAEKSLESAKPLYHSMPYDFVVCINGEWKTVQVKTAFPGKNGNGGPSLVVSLRHAGDKGNVKSLKPYSEGDFDYLFCVFGNRTWMIPAESCCHIRSRLTLGRKMAQYEV